MPMRAREEKGFGQSNEEIARWVEQIYAPEDEILREIRTRSEREGLPVIQVGKFDGLHLEVLTRAFGAKKAVEIGTLGGYSGVCILRGMGPGGLLHTFDVERKHAEVARESFLRAGLLENVRIHLGNAVEKLRDILPEGPFDLVFIDADKENYPVYLAWCEEHVRIGGVVLADNAFAWGHIVDASYAGEEAESVRALRKFSERLARGGRFRATMLPTEEGLAMGVKVR